MRRRRLKVLGREACYHVMSRTVNGERMFGEAEKEMFRKMIWRVADFSGVQVLTYAVMSNHFHVLVRVPEKGRVPDAELLRRFRLLYPEPVRHRPESAKDLARLLRSGGAEAERARRELLARMGDVSEFVKTLKQRFTMWYNRTHSRYGTLWSERFKSVLVEGRGNALQTMAAYIDLNPVRAGLVKDPKDYRYCGYGEAVASSRPGRASPAGSGLRVVWAAYAGGGAREVTVPEALESHRELIFAKGADHVPEADRARWLEELERGGRLPRQALLRCRVRYFTDGAVLGSQAFVRGFVSTVSAEPGRKRRPRIRGLRGGDWGDLAVIRALRSGIFS